MEDRDGGISLSSTSVWDTSDSEVS
jgi:hypothetical protein